VASQAVILMIAHVTGIRWCFWRVVTGLLPLFLAQSYCIWKCFRICSGFSNLVHNLY